MAPESGVRPELLTVMSRLSCTVRVYTAVASDSSMSSGQFCAHERPTKLYYYLVDLHVVRTLVQPGISRRDLDLDLDLDLVPYYRYVDLDRSRSRSSTVRPVPVAL